MALGERLLGDTVTTLVVVGAVLGAVYLWIVRPLREAIPSLDAIGAAMAANDKLDAYYDALGGQAVAEGLWHVSGLRAGILWATVEAEAFVPASKVPETAAAMAAKGLQPYYWPAGGTPPAPVLAAFGGTL